MALLHGEARGAAAEGERGIQRLAATDAFKPDPKAPYAHPYYWAPFMLMGNWL